MPKHEMFEEFDDRMYRRTDRATGWFVGIILAMSLFAVGFLIMHGLSEPRAGMRIEAAE